MSEGEVYLEMYPYLRRKWMNQCVACQIIGYKPELPLEEWLNLSKYFNSLSLNHIGLCEVCDRFIRN